jgi:glutaredoxin
MKVIVYSSPNCLQSKNLKRYLTSNNIPFIEKDVTASEEHMEELYETGYEEAPVIKIDTGKYIEILQGFDYELSLYLDEVLKINRKH